MPIKNRIDMLATGVKTPVGVKVSGPDLAVIDHVAKAVEAAVRDVPGTVSAYAERPIGGGSVDVAIERRDPARYGPNVAHLQRIVRHAVGGAVGTATIEGAHGRTVNPRYPPQCPT